MQARYLIKILAFFLLCSCSSSKSDTVIPPDPESKCAKGKLVARSNCREYVVQVIQGNIGTDKVTPTWFDAETGNTFNNVFAVSNYCDITDTLPTGKEFYFDILDNFPVQGCSTCARIRPVPDKSNAITIKFTPCQ